MAVTRFGMLPTRGTSCDRREGVFRSPAYTPGSADRRHAAARVRSVSAETPVGSVWGGMLCSQRGYRFWRPKVFLASELFLVHPGSVAICSARRLLIGPQVRARSCREMQRKPEQSNGLQQSAG